MTTRLRRPVLLGALALGLAGLGALYGTLTTGGNSAPSECRRAETTIQRMAPLARGEVAAVSVPKTPKRAPDLSFTGPDGQPVTLASLAGRTLVVNLWATWCAPCRHEMPALDRLQGELGAEDFQVVALNVDTRNLDKPKAWLAENGITRLAYYADPKGVAMQALQRSGHLVGLPTTLIIDPAGCELGVLKGAADWGSADAARLIRAAIGG